MHTTTGLAFIAGAGASLALQVIRNPTIHSGQGRSKVCIIEPLLTILSLYIHEDAVLFLHWCLFPNLHSFKLILYALSYCYWVIMLSIVVFFYEFCLYRDGSLSAQLPRSQIVSLDGLTWLPLIFSLSLSNATDCQQQNNKIKIYRKSGKGVNRWDRQD